MQPQRLAMLGINADSYNVVVWVTSQVCGPLNSWWLDRKHQAAILDSFNCPVAKIRKTFLLPNVRDDAINALLGLTQGNWSYAGYTKMFDFLRRSRYTLKMTFSVFGSSMDWLISNSRVQTQPKSDRSQQKCYNLPFVELEFFQNDVVTNSPHLGPAWPSPTPSNSP
jgi:hypothetical protein